MYGGEELAGVAVKMAPCGEQFLGAEQAERFAKFWAEQVLAAVASRYGEIGGPAAAAAGKIGQELSVFIVGVGCDVQHAAQIVEAVQILQNGRRGGRIGRPNWRRCGQQTCS